MSLLDKFRHAIVSYRLVDPGDRVLIALSAGPDSTCLLDLYQRVAEEYSLKLGIAHINYHLRGDESDRESQWIRDIAKDLALPLHQKDHPITQKSHVQEEARRIRYQYFKQVCESDRYDKLSTGHHLDDQIETFFLRLMRGTSLAGLISMGYSSVMDGVKIVRPLLSIPKSELVSYLDNKNMVYSIDRSNLEGNYLRNKLRNKLLPVFEELFPDYRANTEKAIDKLKEENQFIQSLTQELIDSITIESNPLERRIDKGKFNESPITLRKRALVQIAREIGSYWNYFSNQQLTKLVEQIGELSDHGSRILFEKEDIQIIIEYSWITILLKRNDSIKTFQPTILQDKEEYILYDNNVDTCWRLKVSFHKISSEENHEVLGLIKKSEQILKLHLDHEKVGGDLHIRCYRQGDRIEFTKDLGLKKVKEILVDNKIPERKRKDVFILWDEEKAIGVISLPPYAYVRLSDEYYVSVKTCRLVTLSIDQISKSL